MVGQAGAIATVASWGQSWKGPAAAVLATAALCLLTARFGEFARSAAIVVALVIPVAFVASLPMGLAIARRHRNRLAISALTGLASGVALIGMLGAAGPALTAVLLLALCGWAIAMVWVSLR